MDIPVEVEGIPEVDILAVEGIPVAVDIPVAEAVGIEDKGLIM